MTSLVFSLHDIIMQNTDIQRIAMLPFPPHPLRIPRQSTREFYAVRSTLHVSPWRGSTQCVWANSTLYMTHGENAEQKARLLPAIPFCLIAMCAVLGMVMFS